MTYRVPPPVCEDVSQSEMKDEQGEEVDESHDDLEQETGEKM